MEVASLRLVLQIADTAIVSWNAHNVSSITIFSMEAASLVLLIVKYAKTTISVLIVNWTSGFTIIKRTS
jgi:hypothetical protein